MIPAIAVVDDEPRLAGVLALLLRREGYAVTTYSDPRKLVAALPEEPFDLVLSDLKMPHLDGVAVLEAVKAHDPELPVILITAHATVGTAVEAMRKGAFDYIEKPFDNDACRALVRRALELTRLARENRHLRAELAAAAAERVLAVSPKMRAALALARRAAKSRATVLISGESGTGKELVARSIHLHSDRVGRPFVAVNCKAFAASVLESELFGHAAGAFTGARQARAGLFERADGGTLCLDEIGEVDDAFQAKLLRVLQEREVQRVGGDRPRPVDVRIVAATRRDLAAEVAAGRFREDLYFRLAVIPVVLPPLRERPEDILPLARMFLARFARELGRPLRGWSAAVEEQLLRHPWPGNSRGEQAVPRLEANFRGCCPPGNVRELENCIERAAVLAQGEELALEDLLMPAGGAGEAEDDTLQACLDRAAREHIAAVLRACGGVKSDAARRLGVERTTLYRWMKKFGLS